MPQVEASTSKEFPVRKFCYSVNFMSSIAMSSWKSEALILFVNKCDMLGCLENFLSEHIHIPSLKNLLAHRKMCLVHCELILII